WGAVPATIQASLLARLDRLGPAKQVAQIAAAIGREFDQTLLVAVSPVGGLELEDALERLVAAELVFRRGLGPEATYIFKHALVQDAAYDSLLKSRRRRLHADIAAALRRFTPALEESQPELLAHHYTRAGLAEPGVEYWERAGNRALQRSASGEAVNHFRAALALLDALPGQARPSRELVLQIGLGNALSAAEGYGASAPGNAYKRAWELCVELGDRKHGYTVLYSLSCYQDVVANLDEARQEGTKMVELAEEGGERVRVLAAHSTLGLILTHMGRWEEAHGCAAKCIGLYDVAKDAWLTHEFSEDPCVQARAFDS